MTAPRADCSAEIAAPIDVVWKVLVDVAGYPAWNPFVVEVRAPGARLEVGDRMRFVVRWGRGGGARSVEEVIEMVPPASDGPRARWVYAYRGPLDTLGLVRGERIQELEGAGGRTRYRSHEEFHGLFARFVPLADVQDGFERQAAALKKRAEALARG